MAGQIDPKEILKEIDLINDSLGKLSQSMVKTNDVLKQLNEQKKKTTTTQREQIDNNKKLNQQLDIIAKSEQEATKIQQKYNDVLAKTKAERTDQAKKLVRLQELRKKQNKDIRDEIKLEGAAKDSIARKRVELAKLNSQYDRGSATLRAKLLPQINKLTKEVGKAEQATGRHQRNVGNYKDALNALPGPLGRAVQGIKQMGSQLLKLLKNPIVLLIAAIVAAVYALIKAFKSSDSGATEFAARMEQIKAIVDVLRQRLIDLIGIFNILFDKTKTWKERAEAVKDVFKGTSEQIKNATDAAYAYQYALDVLADAETNYLSQSAENRLKIAELEFSAQDRTKSTAERKKALEEAISISEEELQRQQEFASRRFEEELKFTAAKYNINQELIRRLVTANDQEAEALMRNNQEVANFRNKLGDENAKKLEEFYAKAIDLETSFFKEQRRNISRLSGFEEEIRNERLKTLRLQEKIRKDADSLITSSLNTQLQENEDYFDSLIELETNAAEESMKLSDMLFDDEVAKHKERLRMIDERIQATKEYGNQVFGIVNQFLEAETIALDNKLVEDNERLEAQAAKEIQLTAGNATAKKRIEEKLARDKEQTELKYQKELAAIKTKQAKSDKIAALFNAGISTAIAITNALASAPPPANFALAGVVGLLGAAQIAAIAATPIPKFKDGVKFKPTSGFGIVGDAGREIVNMPDGTSYLANKETMMYLPKGSEVVPNYETEKQLSGNFNDSNIIVELKKTREAISNQPQYINTGYMHIQKKNGQLKKHLDRYNGGRGL